MFAACVGVGACGRVKWVGFYDVVLILLLAMVQVEGLRRVLSCNYSHILSLEV